MKSKMPTLSIILPIQNEAELIVQCLERLAPLRTQDAKIIVVNSECDDRTLDLAKPLSDQILRSPRGLTQQVNVGGHSAHGNPLLFLHVDTTLPDAAAQLICDAITWQQVQSPLEGESL
jgi:glycosyltransferase involved in cell wall biosynthesis